MGFLKDLLKTYLTDGVRGKLGTQAGTSTQDTDNGVESVITAILAGLQRNVSTREGAASLDKALAKDHDGSILNDLAGAVGDQAAQKDGAKILDHIFGKDKTSVRDAVSKKNRTRQRSCHGSDDCVSPDSARQTWRNEKE